LFSERSPNFSFFIDEANLKKAMALNVLIAPSGFKESLSPEEVADCIEEGVLRALPDAKIHKVPLVDGGEGFTKTLVHVTGGTLHIAKVTGPVGQEIEAHYGFLGGERAKTAVLEIASAAGLRLVPRDARNPLKTTTYGVGELIKAALDAGAERFLIGSGDSGTTDGGAGMAQALGVHLLDKAGNELGRGGGELVKLERIDMSDRDPRIAQVRIDVGCNFHHVLCGPKGAACMFGPQKGASPAVVQWLTVAVDRYADVVERQLGINVRMIPGGGGSGGLVAGLHVFLNALLHPCYKINTEYMTIDGAMREADLVVTAEGCIDDQTPEGKIPTEVAQIAKSHNLPVIAISGMIGEGAQQNLLHGIDSFVSITESPTTLAEALDKAPELLTRAAERVMRLVQVGCKIGNPHDKAQELQLSEKLTNSYFEVDTLDNCSPEFLKTMARELRTPLNLVMGYAAMVKDRILGGVNPDQERALEHLMKHSLEVFNMINAILLQITQVNNAHVAKLRDASWIGPAENSSEWIGDHQEWAIPQNGEDAF
jgi:glycerate 2-kinase